MSRQVITIVPGTPDADTGLTRTQGTQVLDAHGKPLTGITKIELTCGINDVWRAVIHCHVRVQRMEGVEADFVQAPALDDAT